jgi:hypothetical protein
VLQLTASWRFEPFPYSFFYYFQYPLKDIPQPPSKGIIPWFSGGFFVVGDEIFGSDPLVSGVRITG